MTLEDILNTGTKLPGCYAHQLYYEYDQPELWIDGIEGLADCCEYLQPSKDNPDLWGCMGWISEEITRAVIINNVFHFWTWDEDDLLSYGLSEADIFEAVATVERRLEQ